MKEGLEDQRMQDPLLQMVLPHLGPAMLARLRASCRHLHSLLDDQLCTGVWVRAAQDFLPSCQNPNWKLEKQHVPCFMHRGQLQEQLQEQGQQQALAHQRQGSHADGHLSKCALGVPPALGMSPAAAGPLNIQRLLQEQAAVKTDLSQGASICQLPLKGGPTVRQQVWSPCGTWVALEISQFMDSKSGMPTLVSYHVQTLQVWNSVTGATGKLLKSTDSDQLLFISLAWVPSSSWLLCSTRHMPYARSDDRDGLLSIFCQNAASGKRYKLLEGLCRNLSYWHGPSRIIAGKGGLLAWEHGRWRSDGSVMLMSLPHLKHAAMLSSSMPLCGREFIDIAAMQFNPDGTWIAICWRNYLRMTKSLPDAYSVDVFNTHTHARGFSMPFKREPHLAWAPFSPALLIRAGSTTHLLDVAAMDCTDDVGMPAIMPGVRLAWLSDGSLAAQSQSASRSQDGANPLQNRQIILPGRAPVSYQKLGLPDPMHASGHFLSPMERMLSDLDLGQTCVSNVNGHIHSGIRAFLKAQALAPGPAHTTTLSGCCRLAVSVPKSCVAQPRLKHFDLNLAAGSAKERCMPPEVIPTSSSPIWHPSPAASRIYALAGRGHDLWLIDGQQHRVLQHWQGKDLLRKGLMDKPELTTCTDGLPGHTCVSASFWQEVSWSDDGTRLLLVGSKAMVVINLMISPCGERVAIWSSCKNYLSSLFCK